MNDLLATVNCYVAAWNEREPSRRRELIAKALVEDGVYVDPLCNAKGPDAIDRAIAHLIQQLPGATFRLNGDVLQHNAVVRYSWTLAAIDGSILVEGTDTVQLAEDGRYCWAIGFYLADVEATVKQAVTAFELSKKSL